MTEEEKDALLRNTARRLQSIARQVRKGADPETIAGLLEFNAGFIKERMNWEYIRRRGRT